MPGYASGNHLKRESVHDEKVGSKFGLDETPQFPLRLSVEIVILSYLQWIWNLSRHTDGMLGNETTPDQSDQTALLWTCESFENKLVTG